MQIINAKCEANDRNDFKFYQAFYSPTKKSIDYSEMKRSSRDLPVTRTNVNSNPNPQRLPQDINVDPTPPAGRPALERPARGLQL